MRQELRERSHEEDRVDPMPRDGRVGVRTLGPPRAEDRLCPARAGALQIAGARSKGVAQYCDRPQLQFRFRVVRMPGEFKVTHRSTTYMRPARERVRPIAS